MGAGMGSAPPLTDGHAAPLERADSHRGHDPRGADGMMPVSYLHHNVPGYGTPRGAADRLLPAARTITVTREPHGGLCPRVAATTLDQLWSPPPSSRIASARAACPPRRSQRHGHMADDQHLLGRAELAPAGVVVQTASGLPARPAPSASGLQLPLPLERPAPDRRGTAGHNGASMSGATVVRPGPSRFKRHQPGDIEKHRDHQGSRGGRAYGRRRRTGSSRSRQRAAPSAPSGTVHVRARTLNDELSLQHRAFGTRARTREDQLHHLRAPPPAPRSGGSG